MVIFNNFIKSIIINIIIFVAIVIIVNLMVMKVRLQTSQLAYGVNI
jgi:hypothetical protein